MSNLQLTISSPQLNHKGKMVLINQLVKRFGGKVVVYSCEVVDSTLRVEPEFKTQDSLKRAEAGINEILKNMCEEMDNQGNCCSEHYNCCNCGTGNCGCRYCFSCNACSFCKEQ
ncbi:hypothetical protein [Vibrio cholerae]|uniref:hypothetical protein n=1 Tax=Vibrio cholerae TaxID=666 RepID=UPI0004E3EB95|nr:hypothetical protein [Vibrio cholerae]KFE28832.1 hypothetical protein DN30_290 [Vibrio cholerae]TXY44039.1 hypothetical protein FXE84_01485 [Vibrio cholerae]HAS5696685.1 hypothetical protein [Vibrio cholerae]HAS7807766.1 hypothetical protein [Vibrio cholerae]